MQADDVKFSEMVRATTTEFPETCVVLPYNEGHQLNTAFLLGMIGSPHSCRSPAAIRQFNTVSALHIAQKFSPRLTFSASEKDCKILLILINFIEW